MSDKHKYVENCATCNSICLRIKNITFKKAYEENLFYSLGKHAISVHGILE